MRNLTPQAVFIRIKSLNKRKPLEYTIQFQTGSMLQTLGGLVMLVLLGGWVALCRAFYLKHRHDLREEEALRHRSKLLSLWKPDLTLAPNTDFPPHLFPPATL